VQLVCIDYDYRDVIEPIVDYIESVNQEEFPDQIITVVIPEFIPEEYLAQFMHNQTANILRRRLRHHEDIVVIDVPYHIHPNGGKTEDERTLIDVTAPEENKPTETPDQPENKTQ
jgi:hypothetical protein